MPTILDTFIRILVFLAGFTSVLFTLMSAIRTLVLPRGTYVLLTGYVFRGMNKLFRLRLHKATTYEERDRIMALFAPLSVLMLPVVWLTVVLFSYTLMFWSVSRSMSWREAFILSGSSLMTLGSTFSNDLTVIILAFSEAALGMMLIALLIGYLPAMYSAFSRREAAVNRLEVRAGSPPSAVEMVLRLHRVNFLYDPEQVRAMWAEWELWFVELEESHTTLAPLIFFRSPKPHNSWITTAGTVLDAAALLASTVDIPNQPQFGLAIRSGFVALRSIADFFSIPYHRDPKPDDPISINRSEFDEAYDQLKAKGVPVKADPDQCWRDFAGWRVNYDTVLLRLAALTMAPYAPWISDRSALPIVNHTRRS